MAERVFDVKEGTVEEKARKAIDLLVDFYENTMKVLVSARCLMTRSPLASPSTTSLRTRPGLTTSSTDGLEKSTILVSARFSLRPFDRLLWRVIKCSEKMSCCLYE